MIDVRIIKLSKEVWGFETLGGCQAFFAHVLPWEKYTFDIAGDGAFIAPDGLDKQELVVFSYDGSLVCIARAERIIMNNNKVKSIKLVGNSVRVLNNPPKLKALEEKLQSVGYTKNLVATQGWNILEKKFEKVTVEFLRDKDWESYLK
ncbi:MAG: hypothetical protein RIN56_18630 [Sporomusaceae bacterium]|nr:hypothetical protein [Sporomusaceae bacterium]